MLGPTLIEARFEDVTGGDENQIIFNGMDYQYVGPTVEFWTLTREAVITSGPSRNHGVFIFMSESLFYVEKSEILYSISNLP